ncbi:signal peptidase I [Kordia sp. YSTF-M3]|uniref:Signal peptidase I n=1 Tax=Kordia aestuariivivens TaxID=2759037 RepID=A0ABR7QAR2_9FLAO|nr:signal peptidase I [Kordia aestuariivivens]MBC8755669.1 signal peptidase I [Kordia aestuariivivens]
MNKKLKITSYILGFLLILYVILKYTGICALYTISSTSSEPNLKHGSFILISNLITPKRGDFTAFTFKNPELGESTWMHRLCAMENDTVQIIDGTLFVNGENFDEQYNLQHSYLLSEEKFNSLNDPTIENFPILNDENNKAYITFIEDVDARTHKLAADRYRDLKTIPNPEINKTYQQDWNKDHFGPLVIPKGKVFLLGDNRDNSMDSRFIGLIDVSAIKGVRWKTLF